MSTTETPESFDAWRADVERKLAALDNLDLLLQNAEAALGAHAEQLFGQLESGGHDRATVQQALAAKAAEQRAAAPAVNPAHTATVRMHRSGRMV
jgi:hypothetical protein